MNRPTPILLYPDGPPGIPMTRLDLDPADFQSDLPQQHWHVYYEDADAGLTVGVWTTTDMEEAFGPYPGDEFMIILDGQVSLINGQGGEISINAGETFAIRNQTRLGWKQQGFCRKYFLIYDPPRAHTPSANTSEHGVCVLDPAALGNALEPVASHLAAGSRTAFGFRNDAGDMTAGLQEHAAINSLMARTERHEFVQIFSGKITISSDKGRQELFAGDVIFVPAGTECAWHSDATAQFLFCRIENQRTRSTGPN